MLGLSAGRMKSKAANDIPTQASVTNLIKKIYIIIIMCVAYIALIIIKSLSALNYYTGRYIQGSL
jgi:hypothetical protein